MSAIPEEPSHAVISTEAELLRLFDCTSMEGLADYFTDNGHGEYSFDFDCQPRTEGFTIFIGGRGTGLSYPFDEADFLTTVEHLGAEHDFAGACEELERSIRLVEGLHVQIEADLSPQTVPAELHRREVESGFVVQTVPDYPYSRSFNYKKSFEDWRRARFARNYPGLEVHLRWHVPDCELWPLDRLRAYQRRAATARPSGNIGG